LRCAIGSRRLAKMLSGLGVGFWSPMAKMAPGARRAR